MTEELHVLDPDPVEEHESAPLVASLTVIYSGPVDTYSREDVKIKPGALELPIMDAASMVRAYPEHFAFANEALALKAIRAFVLDQKQRTEAALAVIAKAEAEKNRPLSKEEVTANEARKAAVARALAGEI